MEPTPARLKIFISYNKADRSWAEWIAWTLEEAGHAVVYQGWALADVLGATRRHASNRLTLRHARTSGRALFPPPPPRGSRPAPPSAAPPGLGNWVGPPAPGFAPWAT